MSRVKLWTAANPVSGQMVAEELQRAGIPATAMYPEAGDLYTPSYMEVWLEDEALLEDPDVQRIVRETIEPHELTEKDAAQIEAMPFQDVPDGPLPLPAVREWGRYMVGLVALVLVVWLVAFLVTR